MTPAEPLGDEVRTHVGHGTTRTPRKGSGKEPGPGRPDPGVATLGANERFRVADREADARPEANRNYLSMMITGGEFPSTNSSASTT